MSLRDTKRKIKELFIQDQKDRESANDFSDIKKYYKWLEKRDRKRREELKRILTSRVRLQGIDYFRAGVIFQHSNKVVWLRRANEMAKKGMEAGHAPSAWLFASSVDRILMLQNKKQRFGTQFIRGKDGKWHLYPLRSKTTDRERKMFNVLSMCDIERVLKRLNSRGNGHLSPARARIGLTRRIKCTLTNRNP